METWPGSAYPLGATFDGTGTNFALFSEVAERVELCLFDDDGVETRIEMQRGRRATSGTATCRRCSPASATATGCTGRTTPRRASGPTRTSCCSTRTRRRSPARSTGTRRCSPTSFGDPTRVNDDDSAPHMMLGVVINPFFDWAGDRHPRIPYAESVIYEAHVKGLTQLHPEVPGGRSAAPTPASRTRP